MNSKLKRRLPMIAALALAAGVIAVVVFHISPWALAFGAMMFLHPLLHLGGHGGHSGHGTKSLQSEGRDKGEHENHRGC